MASQTTAFTSVTSGTPILIKRNQEVTYSLTGSATATLAFQRSDDAGANWAAVQTATADVAPVTIKNEDKDALYRWSCTAYTSGTATANVKNTTEEITGVGAASASTIKAYEYGDIAKRTVLECNALSISLSDDAGVAQYGGVKVYDLPEGFVIFKGAQIKGQLRGGVTGTIIATFAGGVSLGTATATTGATLTGTEADLMPEVDVAAATASVATIDAVSVATALTESPERAMDGTATAKDIFLNFVVDDDATHTAGTATFTGTIVFHWEHLGDN